MERKNMDLKLYTTHDDLKYLYQKIGDDSNAALIVQKIIHDFIKLKQYLPKEVSLWVREK